MATTTPSQTAYEVEVLDLTFADTTGLSAAQFCAVVLAADGAGDLALCGAGAQALGVQTTNFPLGSSTLTVAQSVRLLGVAKVIAGGNINAGQLVMSDASGHAVNAVGNSTAVVGVLGIALDNASSGVLVPVLLTPGALIAGAQV